MRFSLLTGAFALAGSVAALPQEGTADFTPAMTFTTEPFTPAKEKIGKEAGQSPFSRVSQNAFAVGQCPSRIEWRRMTDGNRRAFVNSIRCLFNRPASGRFAGARNRYEDLVMVHQRMTPQVHMSPRFLPWHRLYVAVFEHLIRSECGYTGPMTWWDETLDAGNFRNSLIFRNEYFSPAALRAGNGGATCVNSGTFAGIQLSVGPGTRTNNPHCLSRAVDESLTAQCNQNFVNYCSSFGTYGQMAPCAEQGPHAYGHNGIGSVFSDVYSSPGDPVFFMHHGFVDRNWYRWQNADPNRRMYQLSNGAGLGDILSTQGLIFDVRIVDMMDTRGGFLCYEYDY